MSMQPVFAFNPAATAAGYAAAVAANQTRAAVEAQTATLQEELAELRDKIDNLNSAQEHAEQVAETRRIEGIWARELEHRGAGPLEAHQESQRETRRQLWLPLARDLKEQIDRQAPDRPTHRDYEIAVEGRDRRLRDLGSEPLVSGLSPFFEGLLAGLVVAIVCGVGIAAYCVSRQVPGVSLAAAVLLGLAGVVVAVVVGVVVAGMRARAREQSIAEATAARDSIFRREAGSIPGEAVWIQSVFAQEVSAFLPTMSLKAEELSRSLADLGPSVLEPDLYVDAERAYRDALDAVSREYVQTVVLAGQELAGEGNAGGLESCLADLRLMDPGAARALEDYAHSMDATKRVDGSSRNTVLDTDYPNDVGPVRDPRLKVGITLLVLASVITLLPGVWIAAGQASAEQTRVQAADAEAAAEASAAAAAEQKAAEQKAAEQKAAEQKAAETKTQVLAAIKSCNPDMFPNAIQAETDVLTAWAKCPATSTRVFVAGAQTTPRSVLEALATDQVPAVRAAVAGRTELATTDVLQQLARDPNSTVSGAARNTLNPPPACVTDTPYNLRVDTTRSWGGWINGDNKERFFVNLNDDCTWTDVSPNPYPVEWDKTWSQSGNRVTLDMLDMRFDGKTNGQKITGRFRGEMASGTFALSR